MRITNTTRGGSEAEVGHTMSIDRAVRRRLMNSVLRGPRRRSDTNPLRIRPAAEAKLKTHTSIAPVAVLIPRDWAYSGRKKGGTNRGNVANAPARKRRLKSSDLKSDLSSA